MMLDSIKRPGVSPIMSTRQGDLKGVLVSTAIPGSFDAAAIAQLSG